MKSKKSIQGFTLIELVLVIAIMSIIILVGVKPGMENYSLKSNVKDLCWEIRHLRSLAMTKDGIYKIEIKKSPENNYCYYVKNSETEIIKKVELDRKYTLYHKSSGSFQEINDFTIRYKANGSPIQGCTIRFENNITNKYYDISIVPFSGRVLIKNE